MTPSRPWNQVDPAALRRVIGVMTDIDDTLTKDGAIDTPALTALQALAAAGVPVIAITGRPLGWSLELASGWPLRAVVAENGAVALLREAMREGVREGERGGVRGSHGMRAEFAQDAATREANAERLRAVAARVLREVPGAALARDSAGRVTDIAIDHSEFTQMPGPDIDRVVALMREEGMTATVSSIHVNGWFGEHTKLSAAHWMVRRLFGRELQPEIDRWIYVGDSTNDQLMFERFPMAVGVANLRHFADRLRTWPAYITEGERGAGFAEVAAKLLAAR